MNKINMILDHQGKPNNVEAWINGDIVFCLCDHYIDEVQRVNIERMLGLTHLVSREADTISFQPSGKLLISWCFLDHPDTDWS